MRGRCWASPACSARGGRSFSKRSSVPRPRRRSARLSSKDESVRFSHPAQAIEAGVALVTEDRKTLGLFSEMTVGENITIGSLANYRVFGDFLGPRAESKAIAEQIATLAIKTDGHRAAITSLSGGNQQKCILARWLLINPRVLLLDEPTRGIDVGAKSEIYALIRRLVAGGMAVVMTSSELPELLAVSDRIIVLCEGRATATISRADATEESIMHAATQFLDRGPRSKPGSEPGIDPEWN